MAESALASPDVDSSAIVIRGERITVDFRGAVLEAGLARDHLAFIAEARLTSRRATTRCR